MGLKTLRPDITLEVAGRKILLRPTTAAVEAIERRCDAGFAKLYRRLCNDDARFTDLAVILEEASGAAGPKHGLSYDEAFEIAQSHFVDVGRAALELLAGAFGPPPDGAAANPPPAA
jgi:hypothetical protein